MKYLLCTRSGRQHRKALAVCHQCEQRQQCPDYQETQLPETVQALNLLLRRLNQENLAPEAAPRLIKDLQELASLCH